MPSETNVAAPTGDANQSPLAGLGINLNLLVFQLINFAIVAAIIWYLILKPLTKKLSERQKMIDDSIATAKKIQDTIQRSEQKYQQRIDEAKVEANKIIEKATGDAIALTDGMKQKAKREIEGLIDQAKRNIKIEKEQMSRQLKEETAGLVVAAVEKIVREKIDPKKDKELIAATIKNLDK